MLLSKFISIDKILITDLLVKMSSVSVDLPAQYRQVYLQMQRFTAISAKLLM